MVFVDINQKQQRIMDNYEEINYRGSRKELPEGFRNFGMIIPQEVVKERKQPFIRIYKKFGYWYIKIRALRYPRLLDKILRPLCKYDWHRWIGLYGSSSYTISPDPQYIHQDIAVRQIIYQCARCKKTKSVAK